MAIFFQYTDRKVIPNWRNFKTTVLLGELSSINQTETPLNININRQLNDWESENSMGTAADLLGAAYLLSDKNDERLLNASKFILDNKDKASISLLKLAEEINNPTSTKNNPIDAIDINYLFSIDSQQSFNRIAKLIHGVKFDLISGIKNSIWWVELSRLYSIVGQNSKAMRSMEIAINLSPNSRYVLRSATRLFIHNNEADRAYYYLRKAPNTVSDPWLLSAHIATTSLLNKFQVNAKKAKSIVESRDFSYFNLTELSSSLGTLEFYSGAIKDSRKFFEIARKEPNDNSLAQLEWIAQKDSRFIFDELKIDTISNSYEALAFDKFEKEDWKEAANNSIKWFIDIPYSARPIILGSFIFSAFLEDHDAAIKLCKLGLIANPTDITVFNNLMYAYLLSNKLEEANKVAEIISNYLSKPINLDDQTKIMLQATMGLKAFKEGSIEEGKRLYKLSIQNAQSIKRKDLELMAGLNYLRELVLNKCPEVEGEFLHIASISEKEIQSHILRLKEKVITLYNKSKQQ